MKQFLALFLCLLVPSLAFADSGYKVIYDGGSLQGVKASEKVKLYIDANQVRIVDGKADIETIAASSITEISYGQDVHRRIGAAIGMALTKSKKHFVGLTWATGTQKGGFAMQCDKNEYRGILAGLEGISGKKSVDSEAMTVKN